MPIRYRRVGRNEALGITKWKKRIKRALGITAVKRPFREPENFKRRTLNRIGYYSGPVKFMRHLPGLWRSHDQKRRHNGH